MGHLIHSVNPFCVITVISHCLRWDAERHGRDADATTVTRRQSDSTRFIIIIVTSAERRPGWTQASLNRPVLRHPRLSRSFDLNQVVALSWWRPTATISGPWLPSEKFLTQLTISSASKVRRRLILESGDSSIRLC